MNDYTIERVTYKELTKYHWQLLLEADPAEKCILTYIKTSIIVQIKDNETLIAIMVIKIVPAKLAEIMVISVLEAYQGQKIATSLIQYAKEVARLNQLKLLTIATGTTSFSQLSLYQWLGFRVTDIRRDFFTEHYPAEIIENGLVLKDQLVLSCSLDEDDHLIH